ncbi:MAG: hypothetical protein PUF37_10010 [Prevotellaceae bacterium]|nr:hypothetical protein [Prevotellaceae bacterium]
MLNKDFYDDPRDLEIAELKMTISKFKEYDQHRKEYYQEVIEDNRRMKEMLYGTNGGKNIIQENKKLQEELDDVKNLLHAFPLSEEKLHEMILTLQKKIHNYRDVIAYGHLKISELSEEQIAEIAKQVEDMKAYNKYEKLEKAYAKLREDYDKLVYEISVLRQKTQG